MRVPPHYTREEAAKMSASKINSALNRLDKISSQLTDAFIAAGRGSERPSETVLLSDPLALVYIAVSDARRHLRDEISFRYGPGAPSRLPRGFGPRSLVSEPEDNRKRGTPRRSDRLRDQEIPSALGYRLNNQTLTPVRERIAVHVVGDYGADPIGDGTFRMVPSGDIVSFDERMRRLKR